MFMEIVLICMICIPNYMMPVFRAGLRELEALGEVNLVAPNEIEK